MAKFAYNNIKNVNTGYTPFELNCGFYPRVSFKNNVDPFFKSRLANKLADELRELMEICCQNLLYAQELQNRAHNKRIISRSYAPGEKVWLNSQYIKTKRNKKLKNKYFRPFPVLYAVGKQAHKLELSTRWKIHDVFHVSLLEKDTTTKKRVNEILPEPDKEFETENNKEYKVEAIIKPVVYSKETNDQMPGLYYLILWKCYQDEKSIWEPLAIVKHLRKLISTYHKKYPEKPILTSLPLDPVPPMARPTVPKEQSKQKRGRLSKRVNKRDRN